MAVTTYSCAVHFWRKNTLKREQELVYVLSKPSTSSEKWAFFILVSGPWFPVFFHTVLNNNWNRPCESISFIGQLNCNSTNQHNDNCCNTFKMSWRWTLLAGTIASVYDGRKLPKRNEILNKIPIKNLKHSIQLNSRRFELK